MSAATAVALGDTVNYISSTGDRKAAFVVGTPDSIREGTQVPALEAGQLHLLVFSPVGSAYGRFSVPSGESVKDNQDFYSDGVLVNVWTPRS